MLELLKAELEIRIQMKVLPLLIGCALPGPIYIEGNTFAIADAQVTNVIVRTPQTECNLLNSESTLICSSVYMEMEIFVKDSKESRDSYIRALISFVFEHKSLLELLDLITPIQAIETKRLYEVDPTLFTPSPTPSPSNMPAFTPSPSSSRCSGVAEGREVGWLDGLVIQQYDVFLDVIMTNDAQLTAQIIADFERKLRQVLLPALVGCDGDVENSPTLFGYAQIGDAEVVNGGTCLPQSQQPCYHVVVHLDLHVISLVRAGDFSQDIQEEFEEAPLVERLDLLPPFRKITVVDTVARYTPTPSSTPSCK